MPDLPLAYFITIRSYGTWLHGDERGSMDPEHNVYDSPPIVPNQTLANIKASRLKNRPIVFDAASRHAIATGITNTSRYRGWQLHALNVRTNHVHIVIDASLPPERIMNVLKSWATREMVTQRTLRPGVRAWSRHGSTRYLWTEEEVERACDYVVDGQGDQLP